MTYQPLCPDCGTYHDGYSPCPSSHTEPGQDTLQDGSIALDNASVQRLFDYGVLRYEDGKWIVARPDPPTEYLSARKRSAAAIERQERASQGGESC